MSFESIVGNAAALDRLRGLLSGGRLAHAYLFSGPDGVGKKLAALEFARGLGASAEVISVPEDKHEIGIAQVREVIRKLSLTSRDRRAVIFDDADRMSEDSMNALLKTLEEPPDRTVLILVTGVPDRLLPTIRSRCQRVLFFPLGDEEAARFAREALGLGEVEARAAALLAGGSVGALKALAPEIGEVLASARELQARVLAGELNPIVEAVGKIRDTEQARRRARRDLTLLAHAVRDVVRSRFGHPACLATPAFVTRMSALDDDDLLDRIETLLDHQRMIDLNANVPLAVEDALLRI